MIRLISDLHGCFWRLDQILQHTPEDAVVIQLGDLGIWPDAVAPEALPGTSVHFVQRKVYFIDGNHEHFGYIPLDLEAPTELFNNLIYVPRGHVMELDGKTILFLGGAESPDMKSRKEGVSWFREESITGRDLDRAAKHLGTKIDMMVTHSPPYSVVEEVFGSDTPPEWNYSSRAVQQVWEAFGKPPIFSGHLHMHRRSGRAVVLDEMTYLDIK